MGQKQLTVIIQNGNTKELMGVCNMSFFADGFSEKDIAEFYKKALSKAFSRLKKEKGKHSIGDVFCEATTEIIKEHPTMILASTDDDVKNASKTNRVYWKLY